MLRRLTKKLSVNLEARIQMVMIVSGFALPFLLLHFGIFPELTKDDFPEGVPRILYQVYMRIGKYGEYLAAIVISAFLRWKFKKRNENVIFNEGNSYKDYSYAEYWICAKVLGYSKCSLERVPIYTQFRLIRRDTFREYDFGEIWEKEDLQISQCWLKPLSGSDKEVNLMIADTFPLNSSQLPASKNSLPTVKIYRQNQTIFGRYYTEKLVDAVWNVMRNLPSDVEQLNIFATTNPKSTYELVRNVFKSAERGNVRVIRVFQQKDIGTRNFKENGKRV